MFPRSFGAGPAAGRGGAASARLLEMLFGLHCSRQGNRKVGVERDSQLGLSERKVTCTGVAGNFCSTLNSASPKELCVSEFCDLTTPFPARVYSRK